MTTPQKNDRLNRDRIPWRRQKIHDQEGDYLTPKKKMGLRPLIVFGKQSMRRGEIEAIFRWEDDGGRTF